MTRVGVAAHVLGYLLLMLGLFVVANGGWW